MKDLKKKLKAALFTVLLFGGIFGLLYIVSNYAKQAIVVLISIMSIALVYTVWNFIYQEMNHTE